MLFWNQLVNLPVTFAYFSPSSFFLPLCIDNALFGHLFFKMALLNPIYGIIVPFLFLFTIPIAVFAAITTTLAFSILLFRVILVYIELALAVIPHYLLGPKATVKVILSRTGSFTTPSTAVPVRRRRRRSSSSSNLSGTGSITPIRSESVLAFSQSIGPTRDFEGVGGWRLDNPSDDDTLWTNINSRLELPADHVRRHRRSLTSGSMPGDTRQMRGFSPEAAMNTSRARTPPSSGLIGSEGYFSQLQSSPRAVKRAASVVTGTSTSSGSSKGSTGLSMKSR